jgi:hypothetical protein
VVSRLLSVFAEKGQMVLTSTRDRSSTSIIWLYVVLSISFLLPACGGGVTGGAGDKKDPGIDLTGTWTGTLDEMDSGSGRPETMTVELLQTGRLIGGFVEFLPCFPKAPITSGEIYRHDSTDRSDSEDPHFMEFTASSKVASVKITDPNVHEFLKDHELFAICEFITAVPGCHSTPVDVPGVADNCLVRLTRIN